MNRGELIHRVTGTGKFIKAVVVDSPQLMSATGTYGFAGVAGDDVAKGMVGMGVIAGGVALFATSPVVVKVAVCAAAGCFISGFMRGMRISIAQMKEVSNVD